MAHAKHLENGHIGLELTHEEAKVLSIITASIGGCPRTSLRGVVDQIANALDAIEICYFIEDNKVFHPESNKIYFMDGTKETFSDYKAPLG